MTLYSYLAELTSYLPVLPAVFLCYLPVKNQLNFEKKRIFIYVLLSFLFLVPTASYLTCRYSLNENFLTLPLLVLFFLLFHFTIRTSFSQSLAVFVLVCALISFTSNFTNGYDAIRYPAATAFVARLDTNLFHFVLSLAALLLLAWPLSHYGSFLIDSIPDSNVWNMSVLISGIFLGMNILIIPHKHETLYVNRVFFIFWSLLVIGLALMMMIYILFYFIAIGMLNSARISERNHFLEMQEAQYLKLCKYMEDTARARHDFRHTLHTLKILSAKEDFSSLNQYLDRYLNEFPVNETVFYCKNNSVNALLNYLIPSALEADIHTDLKIILPDSLPVSDIDLCSILGNILENAINGCMTVSAENRNIQLSIITRHDTYLYIVATNTFNGIVRKNNSQYLTTRPNGHGIGLTSIQITVEKYNGTVQFSNDDFRFYADIMIPI